MKYFLCKVRASNQYDQFVSAKTFIIHKEFKMGDQTEPTNSQTKPPSSHDIATDHLQRLKDAVIDAQYLLMYAASKCPNEIKRETVETLIEARHRFDKNREMKTEEEADFWLAYQEIWILVQPATAESIKANLAIETTSPRTLVRIFPFLSRWFGGTRTIVKSRQTVNRYIVFTAFVLLLLLITQIYWVIGNQLTTQLADLLDKQTELSLKISDNQKEYDRLQILYEQNEIDSGRYDASVGFTYLNSPEWRRDTLEILAAKAELQDEQSRLKSQQERNDAILSKWSKPWQKWLTEQEVQSSEDKYASDLQNIKDAIKSIDDKNVKDPDGQQTADASNGALSPQIDVIDAQLRGLYAQNEDITHQLSEVQLNIVSINNQLTDLAADENTRTSRKTDLESVVTELDSQLADLGAKETLNRDQAKGMSDQLIALASDANADPSAKSALEAQLKELDAQFLLLESEKANLQEQQDEVRTQLNALIGDEAARKTREENLNSQLSELNTQLTDLNTNWTIIGSQIQSLQLQRNDLSNRLVTREQIVDQRTQQKAQLEAQKGAIERLKIADANREKSRQSQLAGQFVLDVLQGYLLPLLYGVLGAATFVLRTLSKQIETVTYSEEAGIQHLSRISLGALAGIMVGWFSFLINTSTFLGSVSPLAIAFLVGYNIELFFSLMDIAINRFKEPPKDSSTTSGDSGAGTPPPQDSQPDIVSEPPQPVG